MERTHKTNNSKQTSDVKWFGLKRYGYGWVPITWQGWLVTLAYVLVIVYASLHFKESLEANNPTGYLLVLIVSSILLIAICLQKGDRPRWRWG
jgi:hypothetical protein